MGKVCRKVISILPEILGTLTRWQKSGNVFKWAYEHLHFIRIIAILKNFIFYIIIFKMKFSLMLKLSSYVSTQYTLLCSWTSVYLCTDKSRIPRSPRIWLLDRTEWNGILVNWNSFRIFWSVLWTTVRLYKWRDLTFIQLASTSVGLEVLGSFYMIYTEENLKCILQSLLYTVDRGGILFRILVRFTLCYKWTV